MVPDVTKGMTPAGIPTLERSETFRAAKPQAVYELSLPAKSREALICGNSDTESRGQKRKLKGREFVREFAFLSPDCPRDHSKAQVAEFRYVATLEIRRTLHTQAQTSHFFTC